MAAATRPNAPSVSSQNPATSISIATRALPSPPAPNSVTVIPEVSRPVVSTCTRAGTSPNTSGCATQATAHTSCTGGPPESPTDRYCSRAGSSSPAPSGPSSRIRCSTAAEAPVRWVTSSPSMITGQPAPNTIAAASGSAHMLYSAAGVVLPRPDDPPMITKSRTHPDSRGSRRTASAMLVSGPVATRVTSPGSARTVSMMKSMACPPARPRLAVHLPRVQGRAQEGPGASRGHRRVRRADELAHRERVRRGLGQPHVAGHRRDPEELKVRMPVREGDREGVIDPRIAVQDDLGGHGTLLPRVGTRNDGTERTLVPAPLPCDDPVV